jgi:ParB-like chromosome segregation protein Spo0J
VAGRIHVDGKEVPRDGLYGQHYDEGLENWPEWLSEEARVHDPDASAVPAAGVGQAGPVREQLLDALDVAYCRGLGYGAPEESLAAYDTSCWAALVGEADRLRREGAALNVRVEQVDDQVNTLRRAVMLSEPTDQAAVLDRIRAVARRLAAHAIGFQDVLDESDRGPWGKTVGADIAELRRLADEQPTPDARGSSGPQVLPLARDLGSDLQVWPLARVLKDARCGSEDWSWEEEWADLDRRHAETGYLDTLEAQIRESGITVPVLIGSDGRLWDGHHRLRIAVRVGIGYVPVEIVPPAPTDQTTVRAATLHEATDEEGDEGDELVCVDQCGSCDACGMEPYGSPAEGWRQAARFLRRNARYSGDRQGALHAAVMIEDELRRLADEAQGTRERPDVQHAPGKVVRCPDCAAKGYAICLDEPAGPAAPAKEA